MKQTKEKMMLTKDDFKYATLARLDGFAVTIMGDFDGMARVAFAGWKGRRITKEHFNVPWGLLKEF
jgi:hypothetical protein